MNSKIVFTASALFLGVVGAVLTFLPQETNLWLQFHLADNHVILLQILGAMYLGFAFQNWFVKGSLIGGIYNKPILMGNVLHFMVGGLSLLRLCSDSSHPQFTELLIFTSIYLIFALLFLFIMFRPPKNLS